MTPLVAAARTERAQPLRSTLVGFDGSGVLVALLDTGVDWSSPYLHLHVLNGVDVAGSHIDAQAQPGPDGAIESHATEMAGIVVGSGQAGLSGVAPGATILPIRVGGWQQDDSGRFEEFARTDQVIAGLERAVDPDGNGDAHDAARIALIPLAEPFGAFEDGPLALAAAGAAVLDTLVVAPAGNDGAAGPAFGSISGPGGAPAALTVAAADMRTKTQAARLVVRDGLHVLLNRDVPVLGPVGPASSRSTRLVATGPLFTRGGVSRVAGRAVLVGAGESPSRVAVDAAHAGASLVLVAGDRLPAGALGGGEALVAPVLGVPEALLSRVRGAGHLVVSVAPAHNASGGSHPHVAGFSSWGLAFGGHLKPEVAAPGVGVLTVDPGRTPRHASRFVLVDGASAAAAIVAGEAAIAVEARPQLTAPQLKSVLVGTARGLPGQPSSAQGDGVLDLAAAASVEVDTQPATIAFGRASGAGWSSSRPLSLKNITTRWLRIFLAAPSPTRDLTLSIEPKTLTLAPGQAESIQVTAKLEHATTASVLSGVLTVAPLAGHELSVPWAVVTAPVEPDLIQSTQLSAKTIKPSDVSPAVLLVQLGHVSTGGGEVTLEPVLRFDIRLLDHAGDDLGLLARLRDVLPGRYAFGLTGRGPNGGVLPGGQYTLRLLAFPAAGGPAVSKSVVFTLR